LFRELTTHKCDNENCCIEALLDMLEEKIMYKTGYLTTELPSIRILQYKKIGLVQTFAGANQSDTIFRTSEVKP
jgi:hypothetical protein